MKLTSDRNKHNNVIMKKNRDLMNVQDKLRKLDNGRILEIIRRPFLYSTIKVLHIIYEYGAHAPRGKVQLR